MRHIKIYVNPYVFYVPMWFNKIFLAFKILKLT